MNSTVSTYIRGLIFFSLALPEIHTGKVAHHMDADGTPAADKPIHYDNVAIPEVHIHPRRK